MKTFESFPDLNAGATTAAGNGDNPSHLPSMSTPITGLKSIDDIIYGLCPDVMELNITKKKILGGLIINYCFDEEKHIRSIQIITNEDTADFIEGIRIIVKEQGIAHFGELQEYFDDYIRDFDAAIVCDLPEDRIS